MASPASDPTRDNAAYWRERYEDMAMRYERQGRQLDAAAQRLERHLRAVRPALARAWAEGWGAHEYDITNGCHRNPYSEDGGVSDRAPGDELAEIRAEYQRLHCWIDWT